MKKAASPLDAVTLERHDFDKASMFCKRCGLHHEMIVADELLCISAENVVAIPHLRYHQMMEKTNAS